MSPHDTQVSTDIALARVADRSLASKPSLLYTEVAYPLQAQNTDDNNQCTNRKSVSHKPSTISVVKRKWTAEEMRQKEKKRMAESGVRRRGQKTGKRDVIA